MKTRDKEINKILNRAEKYRKKLNEPPIDTKLTEEVCDEFGKAIRLIFNKATKEEKEEKLKKVNRFFKLFKKKHKKTH